MSSLTKKAWVSPAVLLSLLLATFSATTFASTISKANGSIVLSSEQSGRPDLKTVNGRIEVGDGLEVGNVRTTNGGISLGENIVAEEVRTTNGGIKIDSGSRVDSVRSTNGGVRLVNTDVDGDVQTTNGGLKITDGSEIGGSVVTTNGGVYLEKVTVGKDVRLTQGKTTLDNSVVKGDVIINESRGHNWSLFGWGKHKKPIVIIGPNSEVKGDIIAKQDIELYIHESAKVGGVDGAEAEYFSGNRP